MEPIDSGTLRQGRLFAIGDIHGNAAALETVLSIIRPKTNDKLITLGDYIDRGPDTYAVVERLLELGSRCQFIPIMGNHEEVLLTIYAGRRMRITYADWLSFGGHETMLSYHAQNVHQIPDSHIQFLRSTVSYCVVDGYFFTHAMYDPALPFARQLKSVLRWKRLDSMKSVPLPHPSGIKAIVGHSAQRNGRVVDLGHLICLDTCCYGKNGFLTAMNVYTGEFIQADASGKLREGAIHPQIVRNQI